MGIEALGAHPEMPENGGNSGVKKSVSVNKSIFVFADKDGKVDYGDCGWTGYIHTGSKYYVRIQNFIKNHLNMEWTTELISSFQKLIDKYNNEANRDAKIAVSETTVDDDGTVKSKTDFSDINGKKTGTMVENSNEDTEEWDVTSQDKNGKTTEQLRTRTLVDGTTVTERIYVDDNGDLKIEEVSRK